MKGGGDMENIIVQGHVTLAGMRQEQRMRLLECSRAVKDAKNDRVKRKKALAALDQALRYYQACGVLTAREEEILWYTLNRGI